MPVYNVAAYVGASVASVQAQTFASWELIVVDDGSTDETGRILQSLARKDPRIRLTTQQNAGVANARNRGLDMAQGDALVFLDGDDLWRKDYLEQALTKLEEFQADFVFCGVEYLEANGSRRPCVMTLPQGLLTSDALIGAVLSGEITFCMGSVALRRTPAVRGLRFTEGCRYGEDTEYLIRVLPLSRSAHFLAEPLFLYRVRPGSATQQDWDWRIRLDGIHAVDRALQLLHDHGPKSVIHGYQSTRHFWKYRFLYRMVKGGAFKDAQELLEQEAWRAALHSVAQGGSYWHRRKARILLSGHRLPWRLVSLYAELKAQRDLAVRKGK